MANIADLAYAAALIDGEGCICIHKAWYPRKNDKALVYQLTVVVAMTDKPVIEWMKKKFGGHVSYKSSRIDLGYKEQWRWTIVSRDADAFLMKIYPFMVGKKKQADIAFLFRDTYALDANQIRKPKLETLGLRKALYNRMKTVKR